MKDFRTCLSLLFKMSSPFRKRIGLTVLWGILRIVLSLLFVWACKSLIDIATSQSDCSLGLFVAVLLAIVLTRIFVNTAASYTENVNSVRATNHLRRHYFSHVVNSRWDGADSMLSGDMVNRMEEDVRVVVEILVSKIPESIVTLLQLLAASVYLMTFSRGLMWLLLAIMVFAVLCSKLFFRKLRSLTNRIRSLESSIQQHIQENLQNRIVVLTLIGTERVVNRLNSLQNRVWDESKKRIDYNLIAKVSMSLGFSGGYLAAFLWGVLGIRDGLVTYGVMTAFLQLVGQVQMPIVNLSRHIPSFIHSLSSIERLAELDELPLEEDAKEHAVSSVSPEVEVRNLCFSYPNQSSEIFSDFSFVFPRGGISVIAGPTGAGKSTLVRIILSVLRPQSGEVLVDGVPVDSGMRCNFMYVPQGNSLLSGTIRENLLMADPDATDEDIRNVLNISVADFVYGLEHGLETPCGEDGVGLSEGQAQRIAIARALLHKGGVLILDESTSALDPETENQFLRNLYEKCRGNKTVIFISHRESVTAYADVILRLESHK